MIKRFVYDKRIESLATAARNATDTIRLEDTVRKMDIADEINLNTTEIYISKHILSALYRSMKSYPAIRQYMNFFGTLSSFEKSEKSIQKRIFGTDILINPSFQNAIASYKSEINRYFQGNGLASAIYISAGSKTLSGIIINDRQLNPQTILSNIKYSEQMGFYPKNCGTIKSVIDHEIGHILDFMLNIYSDPTYRAFVSNFTPQDLSNNLSKYSVMNPSMVLREVIAEAYSEYKNSENPRKIAKYVGEMIDKKYQIMF